MSAARELDAAGITEPALRASYATCRRLNARHGRTYYLATLLLPPQKRPFVHALYGFARHADDIVDDTRGSQQVRAEQFARWSEDFLVDLDWGASSDPVTRALLDTAARWQIPARHFADFLASMRLDLTVSSYATYDELCAYMWGSAAVIGLQMLPILGRADETVGADELELYAVDLGFAFQLTNFLRDVGEDLQLGRVYLPAEDLDQFGVTVQRLRRGVVDEPIRNLLAFEIDRARALYRHAERGVQLVHPSSRDCLRTAITLYSAILDEIEAEGYDVFSTRIVVPDWTRVRVGVGGALAAWRARRPPPDGQAIPTSTA